MTAENFEAVLEAMLSRKPFKPFTVELHGGTRFEVDHPRVVYREAHAIFFAPGFVPIHSDARRSGIGFPSNVKTFKFFCNRATIDVPRHVRTAD